MPHLFHGQFVFGVLVSIVNVAIQAFATVTVIRAGRLVGRRLPRRQGVRALIAIMATSGTLLTITHLIQVAVWAGAYILVGETNFQDSYFVAFTDFTTIGSQIRTNADWRLLGPIAAANGMLMFGWSTAVLFAVLSKAIEILRLMKLH